MLNEPVVTGIKPVVTPLFLVGKLLYAILIGFLTISLLVSRGDGGIYFALGMLFLIVSVNFIVLPLVNLRKLSRNFRFDKLDYLIQIIILPVLFFDFYLVLQLTSMEQNGSLNGQFPAWTFAPIAPILLVVVCPIINMVFYYIHQRSKLYRKLFIGLLYLELILSVIMVISLIAIL